MESSPEDDPNDTCLKAFVREVAGHADASAEEEVDEPTIEV